MEIRSPNVAGTFYPAEKETLTQELKTYFKNAATVPAELKDIKPCALIVPHAGYVYSGTAAASGYQLLKSNNYSRVILLGPSHYVGFNFAAIDNSKKWETPLGEIVLDQKTIKNIADEKDLKISAEPFFKEHSLEVQLPFLQMTAKEFKLIPICCGQQINHEKIAEALYKIIDKNTLVIASSDLSHYLPLETAGETDKKSLDAILSRDQKQIKESVDACGKEGILILNILANFGRWRPILVDHRTSAEASGDTTAVVGYGSIAYI